jgi:predicted PurR-regulated permease PerM
MEKNGRHNPYLILLLAGAAAALGILLYLMKDVMSPLLAFLAFLLFLWPVRDKKPVPFFMGAVSVIFLIWFLLESRGVLTPFILAFVLAYLFNPLVTRMEKIKFRRWLSSLLIVLLSLALLATMMIFLLPEIVSQMGDLVELSVKYSKLASDWISSEGVQFITETFRIDEAKLEEFVLTQVPDKIQGIFETLSRTAVDLTAALSRLVGQVLNLILVPILFFYLLKDFNRIKAFVRSHLPIASSRRILRYARSMDRIMGGFFRGQMIVCTIVAVLTTFLLFVFGVRYALILGLLAGILNIIPYIGLAVTLVIGILIGLLSPNPLVAVLKIVIIIEAIQILEGNILSPRIVGDRVGLHPVWVIFVVLVFAHFWGILGLLIAVPTSAILKLFISDWLDHYRGRNLPPNPEPEPE